MTAHGDSSASRCFSFPLLLARGSSKAPREAPEDVEPLLLYSSRSSPPEPVRPTPEGLAGPSCGRPASSGDELSYLSRQVVGKAARVRHMAAGSGQHAVERMVTGSSGHHEPPRTPGGRRAGAAAAARGEP